LPSFLIDPASLSAVIHLFAVIPSRAKNPRIFFTAPDRQLEKLL